MVYSLKLFLIFRHYVSFETKQGIQVLFCQTDKMVDRLLPFDFDVIHGARRPLRMEDYLSRHPTKLDRAVVKAETLWNEWFIVNSVSDLNNVFERDRRIR